MIRRLLISLVMYSCDAIAKQEYVSYQNMDFEGGIMHINSTYSSSMFKLMNERGKECHRKGTFCIKLGAMPFVAPCKAGEGTIGKIKFSRGATKYIMLADMPRKVFTIDTKMGGAQVKYFWSSKGLEAWPAQK